MNIYTVDTVGDLKRILANVPDSHAVLISRSQNAMDRPCPTCGNQHELPNEGFEDIFELHVNDYDIWITCGLKQ